MNDSFAEPACDIQAEQAVLGAMMSDPDVLAECLDMLTARAFWRPGHQLIFAACLSLADAGKPADWLTVKAELERTGEIARAGGALYLNDCLHAVPVAANGPHYARQLLEHQSRRDVAQAAERIAQAAADPGLSAGERADAARAALDEATGRVPEPGPRSMSEILNDAIGTLENGGPRGMPAGLMDLDALTGGFAPGELVLIAARPGMGKSVLTAGVALHASLNLGHPALLSSLEMSAEQITLRLISATGRVPLQGMVTRQLTEDDWRRIQHAGSKLAGCPLVIDDSPSMTLAGLRSRLRSMARTGPAQMLAVDYLGLLSTPPSENRQQAVAGLSRGLKLIAREFAIPVVAAVQLNRGPELRSDKRPVLADLKDSGCMPASTRILRADNGQEMTLGELVLSQQQPNVLAVDDRMRLVSSRLIRAFPTGIKPVYRLRLASGRQVEATANHKFLTVDGWTALEGLTAGSFVAVPRALPAPGLAARIGESYNGSYFLGNPSRPRRFSRKRLERMAEALGSATLMDLATSDIYWDEVAEIALVGEMPTFDATVAGTHNFVANGIIAHNSQEADADIVILLHREDYYERESPRSGEIDLIVAKNRQGPQAVITVAFQGHYARIRDMARFDEPDWSPSSALGGAA